MGFRDFRTFNKALLARPGWWLCKYPNSFCAQFLMGLYFPNMDFWNAKKGARASWAWVSILKGRKVLNQRVRWQVNNGKPIKFWVDKWVASSKNFRVKSYKPSGCNLSIVSEANKLFLQKLE
ncbi:unnamed protein product [Camellia sinensis]